MFVVRLEASGEVTPAVEEPVSDAPGEEEPADG